MEKILQGDNVYSYFFWGFLASFFATVFVRINEHSINGKTPMYTDSHSIKRVVRAGYEIFITGTMGGLLAIAINHNIAIAIICLLAIAINHNIAIAIIVGFLAQSIFIALFKWTKETGFKVVISEMFGTFIRSTFKGIIIPEEKNETKKNRKG